MKKRWILLLIIAVIIALLVCYILFVDRPVRDGMKTIEEAAAAIEPEAAQMDAQLAELETMRSEMEQIETGQEERSYMPSYNSRMITKTFGQFHIHFSGFLSVHWRGIAMIMSQTIEVSVTTFIYS